MSGYRTTSVPVRGGALALGLWGPDDSDAPTVLAVHGITASHRCWPLVAQALPGVRVVAPDLRGRGRSADLAPPYGLDQHAEDLVAVLDHLSVAELPGVIAVGHSMGAFVALSLAAREAGRVRALVLVDGGLPLRAPEPGQDVSAVLGPAAERLTRTFADRGSYRDFWRDHPAFATSWNDTVEAYVDYDLRGQEPELRPSTPVEAMLADSQELSGGAAYARAMASLKMPVSFLRAPRGLLDEPQGLYDADAADEARHTIPQLHAVDVEDVNHYTVVMSDRGARCIADQVRSVLTSPAPG